VYSPIKGKQTTFVYGPEIHEELVSRDHLLYKINESVDFSFINEECRNLYSENMGTPVTNTPEIMFRSAFVQSLYNYSDQEMEYEARYNIMGCGAKIIFPQFDTKIFTYVSISLVMRAINFPDCKGLHIFCNNARFFAPQPFFIMDWMKVRFYKLLDHS
jgi:hypothetical protein